MKSYINLKKEIKKDDIWCVNMKLKKISNYQTVLSKRHRT